MRLFAWPLLGCVVAADTSNLPKIVHRPAWLGLEAYSVAQHWTVLPHRQQLDMGTTLVRNYDQPLLYLTSLVNRSWLGSGSLLLLHV